MAGNPIKYAEDSLEVHKVWLEAEECYTDLLNLQTVITTSSTQLRELQERLADQETEVLITIQASEPEWSANKIEQEWKHRKQIDVACRELRAAIHTTRTAMESAENQSGAMKVKCNVLAARLNELGALLNFYAARIPKPSASGATPGEVTKTSPTE